MQQRTSRTRLNSKSPMHGVRAESEFKKAMGGGWCMVEEGDTRDGLEHATQLDNSVQMQPARSVRPAFSSRAKGPPRSVRRRRSRPIGRNILRAGLRLWHGKGLLAQRCAMEPVLCCCALHCSCWTRLATFWSLLRPWEMFAQPRDRDFLNAPVGNKELNDLPVLLGCGLARRTLGHATP